MKDYGDIIEKESDGSFIINEGKYHVPNPNKDDTVTKDEWLTQWEEVKSYAIAHPDRVTLLQIKDCLPSPEQNLANRITEYEAYMNNILDEFAKSRGYTNIIAACSYALSSNATYKAEGERCIQLRDSMWLVGGDLINKIKEGLEEVLSVYEFALRLPVLSWE